MPPIFKALATITVWILFITGCLVILTALPVPFFGFGGGWQCLAVGIASLGLAVVTIKLRKSLD
jgi:hypothetical protein